MPHLEWDESLKVGDEKLDAQHRDFIRMANDLHDALMAGRAENLADIRDLTLAKLERYLREHFQDEEDHMARMDYPGLEAHRLEHEHFTARVREYEARIAKGRVALSSELMKTLLDWFRTHVSTEDLKYRDFRAS